MIIRRNKKRGRGRPVFAPSKQQRGAVEALSGAGYEQGEIADYIGIDDKTLRKHFRRELDFAEMKLVSSAVGVVANALKKNEPWAACFVLKTKAKNRGWSERMEHTGRDGAPLFDLTKLTDDELDQLEKIQRKAGGSAAALPDHRGTEPPSA